VSSSKRDQMLPRDIAQRSLAGLVLPGGGARGAYQAGVLKATADLVSDDRNPFPIVSGASVGAVNAAALACHADDYRASVARLVQLWSQIHVSDVYRTDLATIAACGLRWLLSLTFGGLGIANPKSFLDNEPLQRLLTRELDLARIDTVIQSGALRAIGITASGYSRGSAVTFIQGANEIGEWRRARREGVREPLTVNHILASLSLPFMFPAWRIGPEFPEVPETLKRLKNAGMMTAILSNGSPKMLAAVVESTGIGALLDHILPSRRSASSSRIQRSIRSLSTNLALRPPRSHSNRQMPGMPMPRRPSECRSYGATDMVSRPSGFPVRPTAR
jgi:predicted acylesterase/phospholipase RssA